MPLFYAFFFILRSRIRGSASRIRPVTIELKPESVEELLSEKEPSSRPSFGSRSRNRFRDRISTSRRQETRVTTPSTPAKQSSFRRPEPAKNFLRNRDNQGDDSEDGPTAPKITFKRFVSLLNLFYEL